MANLQICKRERDFRITFDVVCQENEIDFRWAGEILGEVDGSITFKMEGEAHSEFLRNRIGFCVLHPIAECAGQPCEVEHTDGGRETGHFPKLISPHQPFKGIRAISHEVIPGLRAEVRMTGDTFEMEDQRNWTDASYKTYCTPLDFPFPVLVKTGEQIRQQIGLKLMGTRDPAPVIRDPSQVIQVSLIPDAPSPLPSLGLGLASHKKPLTECEIKRLRTLNLSHLRVDLRMSSSEWRAELPRSVAEALALDCALEIALHLTANAETELNELFRALKESHPKIARWIIFHKNETSTNVKWVALARSILDKYDSSVPFGCGADSNFTELNRWHAAPPTAHRPLSTTDFLAYAANPQVHAFDNLSLVENLSGLGETVVSAKKLADGKPVVVSPVTLKPRFNVVATGEETEPDHGKLPPAVDPRHMSLFGAGWTLGVLKYLAENGVRSATFYETTGWRGLMETESGSLLLGKFPSIPGAVFLLYHVFADVGEFAEGMVLPSKSSDPLKVESLALRKEDQLGVLIANLDGAPSQIQVQNLPDQVRLKILDETNALDAMQSPKKYRQRLGQILTTENHCLAFELKPYAIARIDTIGDTFSK